MSSPVTHYYTVTQYCLLQDPADYNFERAWGGMHKAGAMMYEIGKSGNNPAAGSSPHLQDNHGAMTSGREGALAGAISPTKHLLTNQVLLDTNCFSHCWNPVHCSVGWGVAVGICFSLRHCHSSYGIPLSLIVYVSLSVTVTVSVSFLWSVVDRLWGEH